MTAVDVVIVVVTLAMAVWGYSQGLIVGALSLAGFAGGALIGSRVAPLVLEDGARSPYAPLVALVGALLLGGLLASGFELAGAQVRARIGRELGVLDGVGGAVLIACVGLVLAWLAGAVLLQTPAFRELRREVQRSTILQALNETLPPSGPLLNALARFDPFPQLPGPDPGVARPDARIARDPDVRRAGESVVRVLGTACGLGVQGSGWVAGDGVVVTNAHVVAGQDDTTVETRDGARHDADAIFYDPRNDLALLRASGVAGVPGLPLAGRARVGTSAAVLGFPRNGPFDVRPARLGATSTILSRDAYGRGPVRRRVTSLRGLVRSGNSGGPVVDGRGRVLTTVFAATVGRGRNGLGVPDEIVERALARADERVGTGPCAQ